jgi:hypothetical protein
MPEEESPAYHRLYRILIVLVASYLPVVGVVGFLGYVFLHTMILFWVLGGAYFVAFLIFGLQAFRARPR